MELTRQHHQDKRGVAKPDAKLHLFFDMCKFFRNNFSKAVVAGLSVAALHRAFGSLFSCEAEGYYNNV